MQTFEAPLRIVQVVGGGLQALEAKVPEGFVPVRLRLDPAGSRLEALDRFRDAFRAAGFETAVLDRLTAAIEEQGRLPADVIERYMEERHGLDRGGPELIPAGHPLHGRDLARHIESRRIELDPLNGRDHALAQVDRLLPEALAADWAGAVIATQNQQTALLIDTPAQVRDWRVPYATGAIFRNLFRWTHWTIPAQSMPLVMFAVPAIVRFPGFDDCVEIDFPSPVAADAGAGEFTDAWPERAVGTLFERAMSATDLEEQVAATVAVAEFYYRILELELGNEQATWLRRQLQDHEVTDPALRARIDEVFAVLDAEPNELCPGLLTGAQRVTLAERRLQKARAAHDESAPEVQHARQRLARALMAVERFGDAIEHARAVLAVRESGPDADAPETLATRALLIEALNRTGDHTETVTMAAKQVESWRRLLPPADPHLVNQYEHYIRLLERCGHRDRALDECMRLVEQVEEHQLDDPRVNRNLYGLQGWLLGLAGRHNESLRANRLALEHAEKVEHTDDGDLAALRLITIQFAEAQAAVGQGQNALQILGELVAAMSAPQHFTWDDSVLLLRAWRLRNRLLLDTGELKKAALSYEHMRDHMDTALGAHHTGLVEARIEFLERAGRRLDAESRDREIAAIRKAISFQYMRPTTVLKFLERINVISGDGTG